MLDQGKNPNPLTSAFLRRIVFFFLNPSRVFLSLSFVSMADASGSRLNLGAPVEKRGHGRPRSSKNKTIATTAVALSSALGKRCSGHPAGSKNKPKAPFAAPGSSAPSPDASSPSPQIYSFFCICNVQCREIQRLPLKFTKFMDG
jgi:hypothetical protein